jgi:hypothetical protein
MVLNSKKGEKNMSNVITERESQLTTLLELTVGSIVQNQGEEEAVMFLNELIGQNYLTRKNKNWNDLVVATIYEVRNGLYS